MVGSIKKQVYAWIEHEPDYATMNNLFKTFKGKAKESYLRQLYNQYIREHPPQERFCRFCNTMKPNKEILIVGDYISTKKHYACKDCMENNVKCEKYYKFKELEA